MIFTGRHLGFFRIRNIYIGGFIRFFDPENMGVDTKIMILCQF